MDSHKSAGNLGYAAGFIDADGSICIHRGMDAKRRYPSFAPSLLAHNRDMRALERFRSLFGGVIYRHSPHRGGGAARRAPLYSWKAPSASLRAVLRLLIPRLVVKREQAELLLAYLLSRHKGGRMTPEENDLRRSYYERMRALNARERYYDA